ncbi:altered inheritance of mitochondria protein 21 [Striga asiatica]|uniref:Altered inheritance of mitochondria protein 21 n=1 Tax=Striga asiatica TaxID=4170 RepID=A0A5A7R6V9_STRAF|nr:altered inheritance of mitochondria protein 21 [Striga asiatica]
MTSESKDLHGVAYNLEPRALALDRSSLRKPLIIGTIVVDHVPLLNPSQSLSSINIKLLSLKLWAALDLEISVIGHKRSLCPVSLDPAALSSPLVCIPQTAVHSHRLAVGERYPTPFVVVENSNRTVVHQESEYFAI